MLAAILTSSASRLFPNPKPSAFSLVRTLSSSSSRFQVRSMADSASSSPFKKIQIQRDDTVSLSFAFDVLKSFLNYLVVLIDGFLFS
jgi:hypothetical protein